MSKANEILTTGQVARICKVAPRTVTKWFDTGQLRGYRIPGSRDRRIPLAQLVRFMKAHGIPLEGVETGEIRLLVADAERDLVELIRKSLTETGRYDVRAATSVFEAGALLAEFHPQAMLIDIDLPGVDGRAISRFISGHPELMGTQLIAISGSLTAEDRQRLLQDGFQNALAKPFNLRELAEVVDDTLNVFI